ncbi:MAG: MarR family transcriptional regulator [Geobacter sp.]|nr:MarR family transcriptional regulator [Geobacter sp.]
MHKLGNKFMVAEIMDNIRRVFQVVNEQSKKVEKETGLTGPQVWAIKVIAAEGTIRISDLAGRMYLHPTTVVGIIDRLEKRSLVNRVRSREDRRVVDVTLTPEGLQLVANSPEVASNKITQGLKSLNTPELTIIYHGLDKLTRILDATDLPPALIGSTEINLPKTNKRDVKGTD